MTLLLTVCRSYKNWVKIVGDNYLDHRSFNQPAVIYENGDEFYYENGKQTKSLTAYKL